MIAERRDVVICCNTKRRYKSDHRAPGGDNYDGDNSKKTVNKKKHIKLYIKTREQRKIIQLTDKPPILYL